MLQLSDLMGKINMWIIINKYFEYDKKTYDEYHKLRAKINNLRDLESLKEEISSLERKITQFHSKVVFEFKDKIDLIGFMDKPFIIIKEKKFQNN